MPAAPRALLELAGAAHDAVAHLLAHVPVGAVATPIVRASSLFDLRYVAWARDALEPALNEAVTGDAAILGGLVDRSAEGHLLQALLVLHASAEDLRRGATLDLAQLPDAKIATDAWALRALRRLAETDDELVEIARCTAGLVADAYARVWTSRLAPELEEARGAVAARLGEVVAAMPSLRGASVLLSHPMGARGRAMTGRIVVGAPTAWSGVGAAQAAAMVAHEHAAAIAGDVVARAGGARLVAAGPRWVASEHLALAATALRLTAGPVAEAYRAHVATLDTRDLDASASPLLDEVLERLG
jgi:hypothetical protein